MPIVCDHGHKDQEGDDEWAPKEGNKKPDLVT